MASVNISGVRKRGETWQARYVGPDGRRYGKAGFLTEKDADHWREDQLRKISRETWVSPAELKARTAAKKAAAPKSLTVGDLVEQVIQERQARTRKPIEQTTADRYRADYRLRIKEGLGGVQVASLTAERVERWYRSLPAGTKTINGRSYDLLASVMKTAVRKKLVSESPCRLEGCGKPSEAEREGLALSLDEQEAYLAAANKDYRLPLSVGLYCGLRNGEVRGLRRGDVCIDGGFLKVQKAVRREKVGDHKNVVRLAKPKTRASKRTVHMPTFLVDDLRRYLETTRGGSDAYLFPGADGRSPMSYTALRKWHKAAAGAIGHPDMVLHDQRCTALTTAAHQGATTAELMRMAGHTTPTMAMRYQKATDQRDKERAERLAEALRASTPAREPAVVAGRC